MSQLISWQMLRRSTQLTSIKCPRDRSQVGLSWLLLATTGALLCAGILAIRVLPAVVYSKLFHLLIELRLRAAPSCHRSARTKAVTLRAHQVVVISTIDEKNSATSQIRAYQGSRLISGRSSMQPPLTPKPTKPVLTPLQRRARTAERSTLREKQGDLDDLEWHKKNCCSICGSATHWWGGCDVLYCVYCGSDEHRKVNWHNFQEITCPKLLAKQERERAADRKEKEAREARKAREKGQFYCRWANELDNTYYGNMYRPHRVPQQGRDQGSRHRQPFGTPNMRQWGNNISGCGRSGSPRRTWFSTETESYRKFSREQLGVATTTNDEANLYPDFHVGTDFRCGSPGPRNNNYSPNTGWNGRRADDHWSQR